MLLVLTGSNSVLPKPYLPTFSRPQVAQVGIGGFIVACGDLAEVQAAADVQAGIDEQMEVYAAFFGAFVHADIFGKVAFEEVCPQAVKTALRFFRVGYVVSESEGEKAHFVEAEGFDECFDVHFQSGGGFSVGGRKLV